MKYDRDELAGRVYRKRKHFLICALSILLCMIVAFVVICLGFHNTLTFVMITCEFLLLCALFALFSKFTPAILFRPEIRGTNILEVEYVAVRYNKREGRYSPKGSQLRFRGTGANRKRLHSGNIRSTVYLRLEDGNVHAITDLYKSSTDIYEIGDILVKYAGVKYPVIENRTAPRQSCPLCGEVNDMLDDACCLCGLKILRSE